MGRPDRWTDAPRSGSFVRPMAGTRLYLMPTLAPVFTGRADAWTRVKAPIATPNVQPRSY